MVHTQTKIQEDAEEQMRREELENHKKERDQLCEHIYTLQQRLHEQQLASQEESYRQLEEKDRSAQQAQSLQSQLHQQQVAIKLQKADADVLQIQVEEKNDLLEEVKPLRSQLNEQLVATNFQKAGTKMLQALKRSKGCALTCANSKPKRTNTRLKLVCFKFS